jgi:branched-chain amino acid transport system ATP-binding protein
MTLLQAEGLAKSFNGFEVIRDFGLNLSEGARRAIIGPNGAGKTTVFNLITGWVRPDAGFVKIDGEDVTALAPYQRTARGIARSFQRTALFAGMTVLQNLQLASQAFDRSRFSIFRSASGFAAVVERAAHYGCLMGLKHQLNRLVSDLSYGQKRQLEVALALCCEPRLLLLDEPAAGTSPSERIALIELLSALPRNIAILLVEHDMDVVYGICDLITVLNYGSVIAQGTPAEIAAHPEVRSAYLGESDAAHQ